MITLGQMKDIIKLAENNKLLGINDDNRVKVENNHLVILDEDDGFNVDLYCEIYQINLLNGLHGEC